ncbi:hypothetical protein [Erwinia sp. 198]|uniref:hypothetical protein n=1 Tax=Erwinia sp. 198 TaxID=2022746 RepID=UPI000F67F995|nr:hypothetical protein [Erwinia sp. 198]RRZ90373.1 hypothetical protein EGK14_14380 [Erwinia sp. 198]
MQKDKYERLSEVIIGEAVLSQLREKSSVSWYAILTKLEIFLHNELSNEKICAAMLAIQNVKKEININNIRRSGNREIMPAANDSVNINKT